MGYVQKEEFSVKSAMMAITAIMVVTAMITAMVVTDVEDFHE